MIEHEQTAKATIAALQSDFLDRCEAEYEQFMFNTQDHPAVRGRLAEWFGAIPLGILRKEIEHSGECQFRHDRECPGPGLRGPPQFEV